VDDERRRLGLDVIALDAPTGDPERDDLMVRYRIKQAVNLGLPVQMGGGTYALFGELDLPYYNVDLRGVPGSTVVQLPPGARGITVGPKTGQTAIGPSGQITGVHVRRSAREMDGTAGIRLRGTVQFSVRDCRAGGFWAGFDLINNCYGSEFRNCRATFAENYFGVILREGAQSGSDITFDNCWMSGQFAAYVVFRNGGGYRIRSGQASMGSEPNALPGPTSEGIGVFVIGRDAETGDKGGVGLVTITDVDVEGWTKFPAINTYDQVDLKVEGTAFLATQGGADAPPNILRAHNHKDSQVTLIHNSFTGTLTGPPAVVDAKGANARLFETPWSSKLPSSVNGVAFDHFNQLQTLGI
jgi:hypothetical protein